MQTKSPLLVEVSRTLLRPGLSALLAGCFVCLATVQAGSAPPLMQKETPLAFFTNTAAHLLGTQLKLNLDHIQIYPTNEYSSAVHRLLQVAANLCDSTTNRTTTPYPHLPSVFRPLFTNDNGAIYISGYAEVTTTDVLSARMRDLADPADRTALESEDMIYGVPLVVGARKGLPNFNELSMETSVSITRRLQFIAPLDRDPKWVRPSETNQMYVVAISNVFGIEGWNSYSNAYPRPLQLIMGTDMTAVITNEVGKMLLTNQFTFGTNQAIPAWGGFPDANHPGNSFRLPFSPATSHFLFLTDSMYRQALDAFGPLTSVFERNQAPPFAVPHWWLRLNTRLRFFIVDMGVNPQRIVDYVNLVGADDPIDITYELMSGGNCGTNYNPPFATQVPNGMFWCTNRSSPLDATFGTKLQIDVSDGIFNADWTKSLTIYPAGGLRDYHNAIDFFRSNFFGLPPKYGIPTIYLTNVFYSPYNPIRTLYITTSWSASDPLVHYTLGDLQDVQGLTTTNRVKTDNTYSRRKISNIGRINDRYEPWGGSPAAPFSSTTKTYLGVKDPLVRRSDEWDFPDEPRLSISSLGKIHRGTPWQTIYLKSPVAPPVTWLRWAGFVDWVAALQMHPTNDWRMVSTLIPLLAKEHPHKLLSVNEATPSDWQSVLKGLQVLTNVTSNPSLSTDPETMSLVMRAKSPQIEAIIADIYATRANQPSQIWGDRGDVLATPALSVNSPWLNKSGENQPIWGITDEAYEKIPSQLIQLLRSDSIGCIDHLPPDLRAQFTGMAGHTYVVETSSDLVKWIPVSTNFCRNGVIEISEKLLRGSSRCFYRTVLLPPNESASGPGPSKP